MQCKYCLCSETSACPGGCTWHKPNYCSTCADSHLEQLVDAALKIWETSKGNRWPRAISGRPCEIVCMGSSLTVYDHVGAIAFAISADGVYLAPQYDAPELTPLFADEAARKVA